MTDKRPGSQGGYSHLTPAEGTVYRHEGMPPSSVSRTAAARQATVRMPIVQIADLASVDDNPLESEREKLYLANIRSSTSQADINRTNQAAIAELLRGQQHISGQFRLYQDQLLIINHNQVAAETNREAMEQRIMFELGQRAKETSQTDMKAEGIEARRLVALQQDDARHAEAVKKIASLEEANDRKDAAIALLQTNAVNQERQVKARTMGLVVSAVILLIAIVQQTFYSNKTPSALLERDSAPGLIVLP